MKSRMIKRKGGSFDYKFRRRNPSQIENTTVVDDCWDAYCSFHYSSDNMTVDDYEKDFIESTSKLPVQIVPVENLHVSHIDELDANGISLEWINKKFGSFDNWVKYSMNNPIIIFNHLNEMYVLDGQHRLSSNVKNGAKKIKAIVFTLKDFEGGRRHPELFLESLKNMGKFQNKKISDFFPRLKSNPSHDQHQKTLQKLYEFAVMNLRGTLNARHLDMAHNADDVRPLNYVLKHCIDPRVCDYAAYKKAMFLDGDETLIQKNPSRTSLKSNYQVISPDGFRIVFETPYYPTLKKAKEAFEKWREKYERQGYYSSSVYGRINLNKLQDYCEFNKEGSEDWKPFA